MIAKHFKKLKKWMVGHIRAFKDQVNAVERWLVDKEAEKKKKEREMESKSKLLRHTSLTDSI